MAYFSYHNKIKNLLKQGKLKLYYFDQNYKNIGFCMVLDFNDKHYPIREDKFDIYFELIGKYYTTKKVDEFYQTTFINDS